MIITCNAIFPGETCATVREYCDGLSESCEHIIYAHALTTEVAFYVLNHPVIGIITEESSFATHGANILRSFFLKTGTYIAWVSGVSHALINKFFGRTISINIDSIVTAFDEVKNINDKERFLTKNASAKYLSLQNKCLLEYNVSNKNYSVCYWPHRNFNYLTFSIMSKGLLNNMRLLNSKIDEIVLDENGRIWFNNAPLISDFYRWASDIEFARPILDRQIDMYKHIFERLQNKYSFRDLSKFIIEYFSVFLLFHDTYENVLINAHSFFVEEIGKYEADLFMDILMCCKLDDWMLEEKLVLVKRKNLLSDESIVPLPNFSIMDDIKITTERIKQYLIKKGKGDFFNENAQALEFYIRFFVAKEWKFVMNKILFTRFSNFLKDKSFDDKFDVLSEKDINHVINIMEDRLI